MDGSLFIQRFHGKRFQGDIIRIGFKPDAVDLARQQRQGDVGVAGKGM